MSVSGLIYIYYVILRNYDVIIFGGAGGARNFFHLKKIFGCFGQFSANMKSLPFKIGLPGEEVLPIWRIGNLRRFPLPSKKKRLAVYI
jgi:hypothetical protein